MKVYIASLYSRRAEMETNALRFEEVGLTITSRWVYGAEEGQTRTHAAFLDLQDIEKADVVVSFTSGKHTATLGGGRHVEFGYALARGKKLIVIGERENVFHHYPSVEVFSTLEEWLRHVAVFKE